MRVMAIVEREAEAVRRMGHNRVESLLRDAIGHRLVGLETARRRIFPHVLAAMLAQHPDVILVVGSERVTGTVIRLAAGTDVAVSFLPAESVDIVPRRLWGARTLEETIAAIGARRFSIHDMPVAFANGEPFLVLGAFGIAAALSNLRERRAVAGSWRDRLGIVLEALLLARRSLPLSVSFRTGRLGATATPWLVVGVEEGDAASGSGPRFDCAAAPAGSTVASLGRGGGDMAPAERFEAGHLAVAGGRHVCAVLDGMGLWCRAPVRLQIASTRLRVAASVSGDPAATRAPLFPSP